jgi:hypothetical protein
MHRINPPQKNNFHPVETCQINNIQPQADVSRMLIAEIGRIRLALGRAGRIRFAWLSVVCFLPPRTTKLPYVCLHAPLVDKLLDEFSHLRFVERRSHTLVRLVDAASPGKSIVK